MPQKHARKDVCRRLGTKVARCRSAETMKASSRVFAHKARKVVRVVVPKPKGPAVLVGNSVSKRCNRHSSYFAVREDVALESLLAYTQSSGS